MSSSLDLVDNYRLFAAKILEKASENGAVKFADTELFEVLIGLLDIDIESEEAKRAFKEICKQKKIKKSLLI